MGLADESTVEEKEGIGDEMLYFAFRVPKKNHDAMVQGAKKANELFRKLGVLRSLFQLNNIKTYEDMGFTNIAKTMSASQDEEEIWLQLMFFSDRRHMEEWISKGEKDETMNKLFQEFMELITPGSCIEGEFGRLKV
jgi:uncharacterized protein YbaA (DUF1428 family)